LIQALLIVATLIVGAAAAAIIVSQTSWFKNWVRAYIVREAGQYLNGQLTIERLGGNLFYGLELENIGLTVDGRQVVSVKDLGLDYSVFDFISKGVAIDDIRLNRPVLSLRRDADGWSIARLIKRERAEADREGPGSTIAVGDIGISDGSIVIDDVQGTTGVKLPERVDRLDAKLSFSYEPVHYSIDISHVAFRGADPSIGLNGLSGTLSVRDDTLYLDRIAVRTEESSVSVQGAVQHYLSTPVLNIEASSDKLALPEIARIFPVFAGIPLQPAFEFKVDGPLDRLAIEIDVRSSAGQVKGTFVADAMAPEQSAKGDFSVRHLDLAPIVNDRRQRTDLTADARVDLRTNHLADLDALRGRVTLKGPRLAAMGYSAENVKADIRVRGRQLGLVASGGAYGGQATAAGEVLVRRPGSGSLTYDLKGQTRGVNLRRLPPDLRAPQVETALNADYRVSNREGLDVDLRFEGSTVAGAAIAAGSTASVRLRGDDVSYQADVTAAEVDVQRLGREFRVPSLDLDRYEGNLNGHIQSGGTITGISRGMTADNVAATARVDLDPSRVGRLAIDRATVDADYQHHLVAIRQLDIAGRDLNVTATGTVATDEDGQSNLTFHADTPRLEEVAALVDLPLSGIATVEGAITGNRSELRSTGHVIGNGVRYAENGALSLTSDYDARVPDLSVERASITADSQATFVTIAGQNINELTGKTTYADRQLQFDAVARQPERSLTAAGSAAFHPDHHEVHLQRLAFDPQGQSWQLAPGSNAAIQYGGDVVTLKDVTLVSGDQQITAEGSIGQTGSAIRFTATNVDVAGVDALLLRPPQFTGRLNARGTVSGPKDALRVSGDFDVRDGGFRQFKYQSFGGTVAYSAPARSDVGGLTVDVRLQQNPTQWLTAKGSLPATLVGSGFGAAGGAQDGPDRSRAIDLTVDSSPIDLGLVQGFTTELTNVTGALEAHVHVGGTLDDPRPEGAIDVKDGAMLVASTGVPYKNIAGRIDLRPDRLHIDQLTVLDNHDSALSVVGDLAIRERQLSGVQLYVTSKDFKVIDNELGNLRIESSLEVNGELRAPRVAGFLGLTTGQVNLDEIIARAAPSPYATSPIEFVTGAVQEPKTAGLFDGLSLDVSMYVPNDLVLKSSSLQTPDSPIGLGALNATIGGEVRALKDPAGPIRLAGVVNTVRGTYDFQGRRFELQRDGAIRFDGVEELNPRLDIRAERTIQEVEAFVNIRGTLKAPEIVLTSNPPLEPADILALVVFNQPLNQLGEGQQLSLVARAQALATGAIVGQLAQSIGSALKLDTFEIEIAPETGTDALLTVGQQVGRNLYVKVQQGVGDQGMTNVILEYELTRWLRLQTNMLQSSATQQTIFRRVRDSGADLIFFFSY
jgi:hypothetical protein